MLDLEGRCTGVIQALNKMDGTLFTAEDQELLLALGGQAAVALENTMLQEDIERLFPLVPVGVPGEFAYQPVKAGVRNGAVYLEAHTDIYGHAPAPYREALAALQRAGLGDRADEASLLRALQDTAGMPVRLTPETTDTAGVVPASTPPVSQPQLRTDDGRISHQDDGQTADD